MPIPASVVRVGAGYLFSDFGYELFGGIIAVLVGLVFLLARKDSPYLMGAGFDVRGSYDLRSRRSSSQRWSQFC